LTYVPDSFMPQAQALRLVAEEYVERLEEYRQGAKALKQEAERLWRGLQIVNLEQQLQVLQEQLGGASAKEQAALLSQFQETMESLNEARSGLDELSKVLIRSR
jgi:galactokinase